MLGAGDKKEEIATAARTTLTSGVRKLNAKDNGILRTKKLAEDEAILPDFQGCSLKDIYLHLFTLDIDVL